MRCDSKLVLADLEEVAELTQMVREYHDYDHLSFDAVLTEKVLREIIVNSNLGRLWKITLEDKLAGYLMLTYGFSLEFGGRTCFVDEFFVKEEFRGRGLGRQALKEVQTLAPGLGIKAISLEVLRKNTKAYQFYGEVGFVDSDRALMTYCCASDPRLSSTGEISKETDALF